jgi:DNA-binding MarR family transcriptional regulator
MATPEIVRRQSPAAEAWGLMSELFATYGKRRFHAVATEFELSPPQVMALRALDPSEPLPMSSLAGALHCDNSNVTGIVDRLEERGLVRRQADPGDRRVKMVAVTEEGERLRRGITRRFAEPPAQLAALSKRDQTTLRDILRRAANADDAVT